MSSLLNSAPPSSTSPKTTAEQNSDFESYIMGASNQIESMRKGGRFNQSTIVTYSDQSEWVFLGDKQKDRFCGFLYLQDALKKSSLNLIQAASNKMAIHNREIIYLSRYCGEEKPGFLDAMTGQIAALNTDIGFIDTIGNANLRKVGETIFIFDTEKNSFDKKVHEKIDAFVQRHDAIRSFLESRLETKNRISVFC